MRTNRVKMRSNRVRRTGGPSLINSGLLIQALRRRGPVHHCFNCGERMFVKYASGLCPLCFNGRRALRIEEPVHVVRSGRALAGVLDDPAIELVSEQIGGAPCH
jgi:hypothetical protein